MKKNLLAIAMILVLAFSVGGCATKGDLEKVQSQEIEIGERADQAAKDAQEAKAAAAAAALKAEEALARAENAIKMAEERERIAAEKEKMAEAMFQKSMKK